MTQPVQMLGVVCRTTHKDKLELIAFCDGKAPAGVRPITAVLLQETRCLKKKMRLMENVMLTAWFNQFDPSIPVSQQALVVYLEADSLSLHGEFEVTPLGHASMKYHDGTPVHLPTASVSTRKKLYAAHWDQMRGLLREYQRFMEEDQANEAPEVTQARLEGAQALEAARYVTDGAPA